ncbi:HlyD family type I secretion periplasmic adaptor subunit [Azospirillum sp. RWY-5-1]|uniref:Membrane fusion protein (MFP) family protein n=1 Tax=Azospirillum oleiclasticum TaxID=2735135 RepID=A0ABX2TKT9_9PROT|nr:HlyD family type I secretion periplasmic adaptor subunit [Azospirillum oleiclasticum]NYZ24962.1 HlyD family type I secretion periplasmic adaptor subunit [Azospirillum oleiclasticum]
MSAQLPVAIQTAKRPAVPAVPDKKRDVARVVNEFQLDTMEIETRPDPLAARATLMSLAAFVIAAIVWMSLTQLDRIVSATGTIISTAPNIVVQPLEPATIRSIEAKVGDVVRAGTVLARLDPTFAVADLDQIEARIASLNAAVARLEAEQAKTAFVLPPNPSEYEQLQSAIWKERQTEYAAQMRLYDERAARARASIAAITREREQLQQNLKITREVEDMRVELEQNKTGSRLNSLIARSTRISMERELTKLENNLTESRHELEGIEAERAVYQRRRDSETVQELVTKRDERNSLSEQRIKAQRRKEMVQLTTPVDAVVLEVAERSVGSVIKDGEALFRLVPADSPLEVEANVEARQIGNVAVGDEVQIKLSAFSYMEHGVAHGVVRVISSDAFTPKEGGEPFYRARIEITDMDLTNMPATFRLIPGMPLSAEIKVGRRSIIRYLLRPILRSFDEGLREP